VTFDVRLGASGRRDFDEIVDYYDSESATLAEKFVEEFFLVTGSLSVHPLIAPAVRGQVRRLGLPVFPYQVWYRVFLDAKTVEIVAVLHTRQDSTSLPEQSDS